MSLIDDYLLLEIPTHANEQEAKAAFRRLARRYHPDKNPNTDTTEHFQRLQAAYQNVLDAIKQGTQAGAWQPYQFTQGAQRAKNRYSTRSKATDEEQEAFIKERQHAYEQMKRNNAQHERTRAEAIKAARNTLNEKRVKALYEEAFKASKGFTSEGYKDDHAKSQFDNVSQSGAYDSGSPYTSYDNGTHDNASDIPEYHSYDEPDSSFANDHLGGGYSAYSNANYSSANNGHTNSSQRGGAKPVRLYAAKAAFKAATYIVCFAAGVYATLFWQEQKEPVDKPNKAHYIAGLYPQYRVGDAYTLAPTNLYSEPDTSTPTLQQIPALTDIQSIKQQGHWLTVRFNGVSGWLQSKDVGFGTVQHAVATGCVGHPGAAPDQGALIGEAQGKSRLRILNHIPSQSLLTFESYDGHKPFSVFLNANQPFAANFIPRGHYRLVLQTGSLYHHACNQFLFNDTTKVVLDNVEFASTEQSLTLNP